jgi:uncharacterized membrane protein YfcA
MSLVVAAILSLAIGVTLGLLGGGVSTLTLPMLVYVLGVAPDQAAAAALFVVCVTSVAAAFAHARAGRVAFRVGAVFALGGMAGAYAGGLVARVLPPRLLLAVFGVEMLAAALAMMRARRTEEADREGRGDLSVPRSMTLGAAVGGISGLAGVGGGFLVVPALESAGGLGLREAIGTSPFVTALQSVAAISGRVGHVTFDGKLIGLLTMSTMVGCVAGASFAQRISPGALRRGFAWLVLCVAVLVLARQAVGVRPAPRYEHAAIERVPAGDRSAWRDVRPADDDQRQRVTGRARRRPTRV